MSNDTTRPLTVAEAVAQIVLVRDPALRQRKLTEWLVVNKGSDSELHGLAYGLYPAWAAQEAARLLHEAVAAGTVQTGTNGMGLRWARLGDWRIVAHAEGGYCEQRHVNGIGWCLLHPCDAMPAEVESALLQALELPIS